MAKLIEKRQKHGLKCLRKRVGSWSTAMCSENRASGSCWRSRWDLVSVTQELDLNGGIHLEVHGMYMIYIDIHDHDTSWHILDHFGIGISVDFVWR